MFTNEFEKLALNMCLIVHTLCPSFRICVVFVNFYLSFHLKKKKKIKIL